MIYPRKSKKVPEKTKITIYEQHFSDLIDPKFREELIEEPKTLEQKTRYNSFWKKIIHRFFKHQAKSSVVCLKDIFHFFRQKPISISMETPLKNLIFEGEILVLASKEDLMMLIYFIEITFGKGNRDRISTYTTSTSISNDSACILDSDIPECKKFAIHISNFVERFHQISVHISKLFVDHHVLVDETFNRQFQTIFGLNCLERSAMVSIFLKMKFFYRNSEEGRVVYLEPMVMREEEDAIRDLIRKAIGDYEKSLEAKTKQLAANLAKNGNDSTQNYSDSMKNPENLDRNFTQNTSTEKIMQINEKIVKNDEEISGSSESEFEGNSESESERNSGKEKTSLRGRGRPRRDEPPRKITKKRTRKARNWWRTGKKSFAARNFEKANEVNKNLKKLNGLSKIFEKANKNPINRRNSKTSENLNGSLPKLNGNLPKLNGSSQKTNENSANSDLLEKMNQELKSLQKKNEILEKQNESLKNLQKQKETSKNLPKINEVRKISTNSAKIENFFDRKVEKAPENYETQKTKENGLKIQKNDQKIVQQSQFSKNKNVEIKLSGDFIINLPENVKKLKMGFSFQ